VMRYDMKTPLPVLLMAASLLFGCSKASDKDAVIETPVRAAEATEGPAVAPIEANGLIGARDEMRLSFKTGGIVRRIAVQEGEAVRQGTLLAELELTEIQAQAEQALQMAQKADRDLERGERLYADQVISLEALQNLRTQAAVARAGRDAARFNLGYSRITAPRDGVVLRKLVEERELVPPGQPVVILGSADRGHVLRFALSDRNIVRIKPGDSARVRLDAYPGVELKGVVSEVSSAADPRTGLFPAQVRLDSGADIRLASGLVANVTIEPAQSGSVRFTYVPVSAIVEGEGRTASVFVIDGTTARKRLVRVGFIKDEQVALAEGLKPGERVVTEGSLYLVDGERIRVVDASTGAATAAALVR
jgi:multidrug efflux system membrane fusion protein